MKKSKKAVKKKPEVHAPPALTSQGLETACEVSGRASVIRRCMDLACMGTDTARLVSVARRDAVAIVEKLTALDDELQAFVKEQERRKARLPR